MLNCRAWGQVPRLPECNGGEQKAFPAIFGTTNLALACKIVKSAFITGVGCSEWVQFRFMTAPILTTSRHFIAVTMTMTSFQSKHFVPFENYAFFNCMGSRVGTCVIFKVLCNRFERLIKEINSSGYVQNVN